MVTNGATHQGAIINIPVSFFCEFNNVLLIFKRLDDHHCHKDQAPNSSEPHLHRALMAQN